MQCKKCGSNNMTIINEQQIKTKHRGIISWLFWIILAFCTFGIILIIPLLTNTKVQTKNKQIVICNNCGARFKLEDISKEYKETLKKEENELVIKLLIVLIPLAVIVGIIGGLS